MTPPISKYSVFQTVLLQISRDLRYVNRTSSCREVITGEVKTVTVVVKNERRPNEGSHMFVRR